MGEGWSEDDHIPKKESLNMKYQVFGAKIGWY